MLDWFVYGVLLHFQQYFSYIVVVGFIGGFLSVQYTWTERKPPICHKPLINLITEQEDVSSTPGPGENHQSVTSH